jgi:hypothetical protein
MPSIDFELIIENLLNLMKGGRSKTDYYGTPLVLSLRSMLEANLSDRLIVDTFLKHGPDIEYRSIVDG